MTDKSSEGPMDSENGEPSKSREDRPSLIDEGWGERPASDEAFASETTASVGTPTIGAGDATLASAAPDGKADTQTDATAASSDSITEIDDVLIEETQDYSEDAIPSISAAVVRGGAPQRGRPGKASTLAGGFLDNDGNPIAEPSSAASKSPPRPPPRRGIKPSGPPPKPSPHASDVSAGGPPQPARPKSAPPPPPSRTKSKSVAPPRPATPKPPPTPKPKTTPPPPLKRPVKKAETPAAPTPDLPPPGSHVAKSEPPRPRLTTKVRSSSHSLEVPVELAAELRARVDRLRNSDAVGAARALTELGLLHDHIEKRPRDAKAAYKNALRISPSSAPALLRLKRRFFVDGEPEGALELIESELGIADSDMRRADLLAESGRTMANLGRAKEARAAFAQALSLIPTHPAALRGLEASLRDDEKTEARSLCAHLDKLSAIVTPQDEDGDGDRRLASWLQVERALLLDRRLKDADLAESALSQAVLLEPAPGPARTALTHHLLRHQRFAVLTATLAGEADREGDADRAARLLFAAAQHAIAHGSTPDEALVYLRRAVERSSSETLVAHAAYEDVIRQLLDMGADAAATEYRERALSIQTDDRIIAHEHAALSRMHDRLGNVDRAVDHARRALFKDPSDSNTKEQLDRCLHRLENHEERVALHVRQANTDAPTGVRIEALLRAARISEMQLGQRDVAIAHLNAAWVLDEGNQRIFDELAALCSPSPIEPNSEQAEGRGIRQRLDLYTRAAAAQSHPVRRIALLEKLATVWEEELVQPDRALEVLDEIHRLEPSRHGTIVSIQRCAKRAGNYKRLAEALVTEADLVGDKDDALRRVLLLRAADVARTNLGDADRASALIDRALALDPKNESALNEKWRAAAAASRYAEARKALMGLIEVRTGPESFRHWIEIALIDEHHLKNPVGAVNALKRAHQLSTHHPMPKREIARLLKTTKDHVALAKWYTTLGTDDSASELQRRQAFVRAAEVYEFALADDTSAIRALESARAFCSDSASDLALTFEAHQRILARRDSLEELSRLYEVWLEKDLPLTTEQSIRVSSALSLGEDDPANARAIKLLGDLVERAPLHIIALRLLEQRYRRKKNWAQIGVNLRSQVEALSARVARCGVLWEIVQLKQHLGLGPTFGALKRLISESPFDRAALEMMVQVGLELGQADAEIQIPAARGDLVAAIRAVRELTTDRIEKAAWYLEEALVVESQADDPEDTNTAQVALGGYLSALSHWPESLIAARAAARIATRLGHREGSIAAETALADLVEESSAKAGHLMMAAELIAGRETPVSGPTPLELYEQALKTHPDASNAVDALLRYMAGDPAGLAERLRAALVEAQSSSQIVRLGTEIANLALGKLDNPALGVSAMRRVLEVQPEDVPSLMAMAQLLSAQQLWPEARDTLLKTAELATDAGAKYWAHLDVARLLCGPLADPKAARKHVDAALAVNAESREALELLHDVARKLGDAQLAAEALGRIAALETDASARARLALRLAETRRELGDEEGALAAICDAVVSAPKDAESWKKLEDGYRSDAPDAAENFAKGLRRLLDVAQSRQVTPEAIWLSTLGLLEATTLRRPEDGLARLRQAVELPDAPPDATAALARGLSAAGRNGEALAVLREGLLKDPDALPNLTDVHGTLEFWESTLATEGRVEERISVEDGRACLGSVGAERANWLRNRHLPAGAPYADSFAGAELSTLLAPELQTPARDACLAFMPMTAKALRFEVSNLGLGSREKVGPRDGFATRTLCDQLARGLGVTFEFYIAPHLSGPPKVYPGDPPIIVAPREFADYPVGEQAFALARLLARIAIGVPWLDEVPDDSTDGFVLALLRTANPRFGSGEVSTAVEDAAELYGERARKAVGWLQKRRIEEIIAVFTSGAEAHLPAQAVRDSEDRIAYAITGNLLAAIDFMRRTDPIVAEACKTSSGLLTHRTTSGLLRFALSGDAYLHRHRAGILWSG